MDYYWPHDDDDDSGDFNVRSLRRRAKQETAKRKRDHAADKVTTGEAAKCSKRRKALPASVSREQHQHEGTDAINQHVKCIDTDQGNSDNDDGDATMETTTNKSRKTLLVKLRFGSETLKIHNCRAILDNRKVLLVKLKFDSKNPRIHNGRATLHNAENKSRESLPMKTEPGHQTPRINSNKLKSEGVATDLKSYPMSGLPHYSALLDASHLTILDVSRPGGGLPIVSKIWSYPAPSRVSRATKREGIDHIKREPSDQ